MLDQPKPELVAPGQLTVKRAGKCTTEGGRRILTGGRRDTFNLSTAKPQKTTSAEQLVTPYYHAKLLVQQPALSNNKQQDYKGVSITARGAKPHAHAVQ